MEKNFKVGDIVTPDRESAHPFCRNPDNHIEWEVVKVWKGLNEEENIRIVKLGEPENRYRSFYAKRFNLVRTKVKYVRALQNIGVFVNKGDLLVVETEDEQAGSIKFVDVPAWYRNTPERFEYVDLAAAPVAVAVKPKEPSKAEQMLAELTKKSEAYGGKGVCFFARGVDDKPENWGYHVPGPCHAALGYGAHKYVVANISMHYKALPDEEQKRQYRQWVDYIVQRSPFASCFIKAKTDDVLKSGVIMDTENKSQNEIVAALVALRSGSEFPWRLHTFSQVVDLGFSENLALFMSQFFQEKADKDVWVYLNDGSHGFLQVQNNFNELCEFFNTGKFMGKIQEKPFAKEGNGYVVCGAITKLTGGINNIITDLKGLEGEAGGWNGGTKRMKGKNAFTRIAAQLAKHID